MQRAVAGLEGLIDDYEFHYPGELNEDNLDDVRAALGDHGIYCIASGLHVDHRFGKGGLTSVDPGVRETAREITRAAADFAGGLGAHFIIWPGIEGYNYPFQAPYRESWARLIEGIGEAAEICAGHGVKLFLEHKNSEPAMKIHMGNIGMALHIIHKLRAEGIDNVQVNMDWQHLIMNGENLAEYAALLDAEGLLGHQHAQLRLGHVRRRQHGRRDRVHGDARAGASSCGAPATAPTASGSASTSTRTPRTRSRPSRARCEQWRFIDDVAGAHRRRGAARGAGAQGRGARLRARLRGAGSARA